MHSALSSQPWHLCTRLGTYSLHSPSKIRGHKWRRDGKLAIAVPDLELNCHLLSQKSQNRSQLGVREESHPILDPLLHTHWTGLLAPAAPSNHMAHSSTYHSASPDVTSPPKLVEAIYIQAYSSESLTLHPPQPAGLSLSSSKKADITITLRRLGVSATQ